MASIEQQLQQQVLQAYHDKTALEICAGGSKFKPSNGQAQRLDVLPHSGIIEYEPSELVMVVRAGTPLAEVQSALAAQNQMLGFDPPFASDGATIGGAIATGFAGAGRPYYGGARDFILGAKIINGRGEVLQFGGKVMKNVAGFDVFRPMAGALGTLGVLLEVSIRLLPVPPQQKWISVICEDQAQAIEWMNKAHFKCTTLSAAQWQDAAIMMRLSGTPQAIEYDLKYLPAYAELGVSSDAALLAVAERRADFFAGSDCIFRCVLPPAADPIVLDDVQQLMDWGGAQRFIKASASEQRRIEEQVTALGGRAMPLLPNRLHSPLAGTAQELFSIQKKLKAALDPYSIFNAHLMPQVS